MLTITIKATEAWDPVSETFKSLDRDWTLKLEHSLMSIEEWEAIHKKPFLSKDYEKTNQDIMDYVKCMTITPNVPDDVYMFLSPDNMKKINEYINDSRSATWFRDNESKMGKSKMPRREVMTSELIYYYMTINGISWEAKKWHINRLLTLIRIHSEKDSNGSKMSKKDIINRNSELNKMRRMALGSKG